MEIFGLKVSEISHEGNYVDCELRINFLIDNKAAMLCLENTA